MSAWLGDLTCFCRIIVSAVQEATMAYKLWCKAKEKKEEDDQVKDDRKPAPYKHIKVVIKKNLFGQTKMRTSLKRDNEDEISLDQMH